MEKISRCVTSLRGRGKKSGAADVEQRLLCLATARCRCRGCSQRRGKLSGEVNALRVTASRSLSGAAAAFGAVSWLCAAQSTSSPGFASAAAGGCCGVGALRETACNRSHARASECNFRVCGVGQARRLSSVALGFQSSHCRVCAFINSRAYMIATEAQRRHVNDTTRSLAAAMRFCRSRIPEPCM